MRPSPAGRQRAIAALGAVRLAEPRAGAGLPQIRFPARFERCIRTQKRPPTVAARPAINNTAMMIWLSERSTPIKAPPGETVRRGSVKMRGSSYRAVKGSVQRRRSRALCEADRTAKRISANDRTGQIKDRGQDWFRCHEIHDRCRNRLCFAAPRMHFIRAWKPSSPSIFHRDEGRRRPSTVRGTGVKGAGSFPTSFG